LFAKKNQFVLNNVLEVVRTLNERLIFLYWFGKKSTRLIKIFLKRINSSVLESLIVNLVRTAALYKMAKGVLKSKHNSLV